ncbi:MAG TPA: M48 family metalloprotease [Gaiellaceae bacterium]|nr:M48 family metalloprotease [Gaiellaceae bacterium]
MLAARNLLKLWLLLIGFCVVLALVGWRIGGLRVLSLFIFCGLLVGVASYWYADRFVLGIVGARELLPAESPVLHSTVERLSARAGVVKPRLYVVVDAFPRALAAGRGPRGGSAIVLSSGLIGVATPAELEGVIAHELAHLRTRDVLVQTTAVLISVLIVETSRVGGFLQRALLFVLGPVAAAFTHLLLSPKREFAADREAARICGSPHGLADALIRLEHAMELVSFRASPATEPLYTANPFAETGLAALFVTHPPIADRVRRLRALDPGWKDRLRAA